MSFPFIALPTNTKLGKFVFYINLPSATAFFVLTMLYPSFDDAAIPVAVRAFLPGPWLSMLYFVVSVWVLPIVAGVYEHRVALASKRSHPLSNGKVVVALDYRC